MSEEHDMKRDDNMEQAETALTPDSKEDIGFWKDLIHQGRLVWYLLRDPEVPFYLKILPLAAILYVIIPTDLIPDLALGVGQLDDITALVVGAKVFIEMAPPHVVSHYLRMMRGQGDESVDQELDESIIIEGDFNPVEKSPEDLE